MVGRDDEDLLWGDGFGVSSPCLQPAARNWLAFLPVCLDSTARSEAFVRKQTIALLVRTGFSYCIRLPRGAPRSVPLPSALDPSFHASHVSSSRIPTSRCCSNYPRRLTCRWRKASCTTVTERNRFLKRRSCCWKRGTSATAQNRKSMVPLAQKWLLRRSELMLRVPCLSKAALAHTFQRFLQR
eukprot:scaffold703_cov245-Pinguiococcus_pyrenoidosus.AAC.9